MLLDSSFYENAVNSFKLNFQEIFTDNIMIVNGIYNFEAYGYFKLVFKYLPLEYDIIVENEIRTFTITIIDEEGAQNSLYRIQKFDNSLEGKNIKSAVILLKQILDQNKFNFYLYKNDKVYRKNGGNIKRVKDIKEI